MNIVYLKKNPYLTSFVFLVNSHSSIELHYFALFRLK